MKFFSCLFTFLFFSASAFSAVFFGEVHGTRFQWGNMGSSYYDGLDNNGQVSGFWDLPSSLPAAKAWVPGGPTKNSVEIKLSGPETVSTPIKVNILAIQYKSYDYEEYDISSGSDIQVNPFEAGEISVQPNLFANKLFKLTDTNRSTPFSHIRPVVGIDTGGLNGLVEELKVLEEGLYQGSAFYTVAYDYYPTCNSISLIDDDSRSPENPCKNDIKIRNIITQKITIQIENRKNKLTEIHVTGLDKMQTSYSDSNNMVSGKTTYHINAKGYLQGNITARLHNRTKSNYVLKNTISGDEIPYSVKCVLYCPGSPTFIDKGTSKNTTTTLTKVGNNDAFAEIEVFFADQDMTNLATGKYAGEFSLIFELEDV